jgi:error-prone DNA polymerase
MPGDPFVHLHVASGYSLRYGASHPHALVERAVEHEMDTLALTDRDGLYGAVRFTKACMQGGVRPVLGVDLAVEPVMPSASSASSVSSASSAGSSTGRGLVLPPARRVTPARGGSYRDPRHPRVRLLATGRQGWAALCRLVSATHLCGERGSPVTTLDLVAEHTAGRGVLVLLGPDSELGRVATMRRDDLAAAVLRRWADAVGRDDLVVEVYSHRLPGAGPGSSPHAGRMARVGRSFGAGVVLTNAVRYADRLDAPTVDVLDSVRRLVPLDLRHIDRGNAEGFLKSGKEMAEIAVEVCRFAGFDEREAQRLLAHTRTVADRCALDPRADLGLGEVHLPDLDTGGSTADAVLRARCEEGVRRRYAAPGRRIWDRLDDELDTIARLGYAAYFLTVGDVCDLIRGMDVRCAARGSGAGSLVNYALGVSGVDPIRHGLLMERFLSPLRQALPDVDVDVESARRTEVYERILERFGSDRCACVSMMDTYRVRHAVRDVGMALGMPAGEVDAIAKAFPHIRARDARLALRDLPELRASGLGEQRLDVLFRLVERLDGLPRHVALHPCGVLLSDRTLLDRTPVEASFVGFPMSQFDKDDVEDLGLLKLDVLGVRMQSAMAHAVDEISRVEGEQVDLDDQAQVPLDDPATFTLVQHARTLGCFQIESPGQRELVGKFAPETFDDIIIDISLFRPGPVKSDMVTPFLRARQGWSVAEYLHPDLEPILRQTAGVVVFHEQVIEMIEVFTGCTPAEADEARRALGDLEGKDDVRLWFFPRALGRGYPEQLVQEVWSVLEAFASFGFCKAHAAAFALPTYQSAWLKAHYPAHFLAGVLTHDPGMYPKRLILDDARQFDIAVLPLDVNASDDVYRVERVDDARGIRLALADVKGISDDEVAQIVAGRPYHSLTDFWHRARVSRPVAERLVLAGAFDSLYGISAPVPVRRRGTVTRRDLLLQVADLDRWSKAVERAHRHTSSPAQLTFDLGDAPGEAEATGLPEMSGAERVRAELEVLGMDVSRHVVDFYVPLLRNLGVVPSRDLLRRRSRSSLLVAGVKVATQTPPVRSGRRVVFLTLDDGTGPIDATFFEDAQGPFAATLFHSWLLLVRGELRRTGPRGVSLRATGCWELTALHALWQREGIEGVLRRLEEVPEGFGPASGEEAVRGAAESRSTRPVMAPVPGSSNGPPDRQRVLVHASGFKVSPYADVRPAGGSTKDAPRKLWHTSPGSPG